jgi:hypothetical protein
MSYMERSIADRQPTADPRPTQVETDTYKRDPQIRSLILPDLISADALIPAWLRRLLHRTNARASR